jgi:hypothetical protein
MENHLVRKRISLLAGVGLVTVLSLAVVSTGAYFTDSKPGAITGNLGTVAINTDGQNINFANLMPGETQTQTVWVQNTGTGNEDIYVVFSNDNKAWSAVNNLGQYGKFTVNGKVYDNLNNAYEALTPGLPGTPNGNGPVGPCGTEQIGANYLPHVIKLGTLTPGQLWSFDISFQFNACLSSPLAEGAPIWGAGPSTNFAAIPPAPLEYVIAAFQPGVDPLSNLNGNGKINPLALPISGDTRTPAGTWQ